MLASQCAAHTDLGNRACCQALQVGAQARTGRQLDTCMSSWLKGRAWQLLQRVRHSLIHIHPLPIKPLAYSLTHSHTHHTPSDPAPSPCSSGHPAHQALQRLAGQGGLAAGVGVEEQLQRGRVLHHRPPQAGHLPQQCHQLCWGFESGVQGLGFGVGWLPGLLADHAGGQLMACACTVDDAARDAGQCVMCSPHEAGVVMTWCA